MIYVRGQPEDFDYWAQLGNRGWSWDDVLPFCRKAENWEGKEDLVRGKGGPLFTSHGRDRTLLCQAAIEAGRQLGLEHREDVNDLGPGAGDGIGRVQQTRGGRRRASAARSYLRPAMKRSNLHIITGALVHRVRFDGMRAIGVEYSRNGSVQHIEAEREVILALARSARRISCSSPASVIPNISAVSASTCITPCVALDGTCRTITSRASPARCRVRQA